FKAVLRGIERRRRHGQHRQELGQHQAVLRVRLRGVFGLTGRRAALPFCAPTLCLRASNNDKIVGAGADTTAASPASLASSKAFSSCAAWSGYAVQSTLPLVASISIPAKRSSSAGSFSSGHSVCGQTRTCSG